MDDDSKWMKLNICQCIVFSSLFANLLLWYVVLTSMDENALILVKALSRNSNV